MNLEKVTTPTQFPVTLESVKDHLRIERNETAFDSQLEELIGAAVEYVEGRTHLRFITTQFRAKWDTFPDNNLIAQPVWWYGQDEPQIRNQSYIKIPLFPVVSVDSVQYYDIGGTLQTLTGYQTELIQTPAKIWLGIGQDWPATQVDKINAVIVTFTAGYGTGTQTQPYIARHMIRMLVAHWFRNAEAVITGTNTKEIELAFDALKNQLRVNEFEEFLA